jgi:glycerate dehydrogenase
MKAAFLDFATVGSDELDISPLSAVTDELEIYDNTAPGEISARIDGVDIVYINKARMTREIIDSATSLKLICLVATGTDNVDLEAARDNGVAVCNIRAYCTNSVVTHSLGLYHTSVRSGDWQKAVDFCMLGYPIRELSAMTIGVVGFGQLGRGVARIAEAFGMKVLISARPGAGSSDDDRIIR